MRVYIAGSKAHQPIYKAIEGKNIYPSWHTVGGLKFLPPNEDYILGSHDCIVLFSSIFNDKEHLQKYVLNLRNMYKGVYIVVVAKKEYEQDLSFRHALERASTKTIYCNKINAEQLLELMPKPKPKVKIVYEQEPEYKPPKQQVYIKNNILTRLAIRYINRKAVLSEGCEPITE